MCNTRAGIQSSFIFQFRQEFDNTILWFGVTRHIDQIQQLFDSNKDSARKETSLGEIFD